MTAQQDLNGLLFGNFSPELKILLCKISIVDFTVLPRANRSGINVFLCLRATNSRGQRYDVLVRGNVTKINILEFGDHRSKVRVTVTSHNTFFDHNSRIKR